MEAPPSPSTCLSLSSDFFSPAHSFSISGSHAGSWPNSCTSSPKRAPERWSNSCPSSPKRHHQQHYDDIIMDASFAVDCTLSLGNAATRKSDTPEAPSRLSRAGSPVAELVKPSLRHPFASRMDLAAATQRHGQGVLPCAAKDLADLSDSNKVTIAAAAAEDQASRHYFQQQSQWPRIHQARQHHEVPLPASSPCHNKHYSSAGDIVSEAANRSLNANFRRIRHADIPKGSPSSADFYRQSILATQNSQFPAFSNQDSAMGSLNKFGFLEFPSVSSQASFGFLDSFKANAESCSTRSRFRGLDVHNDPRNVPRICAHCGTSSTPLWRNGPLGPKSLCNACGIRFKKVGRRSPAAAPTSNASGGSWNVQSSAVEPIGFPIKRCDPPQFNDHQAAAAAAAEMKPGRMMSPVLQDKRCRMDIPFAKEWSAESPCSSNAVGSSCITWQESMPSSMVCSPTSSLATEDKLVLNGQSRSMSLLDDSGRAPPVVLDAEVIRSVPVLPVSRGQGTEDRSNFLRISL